MDSVVALLNAIAVRNHLTVTYDIIAIGGQAHAPTFTFRAKLLDFAEEGTAQSKKKAKQIAARNMVRHLLDESDLFEDRTQVKQILMKCDQDEIAEALLLQRQLELKKKEMENTETKNCQQMKEITKIDEKQNFTSDFSDKLSGNSIDSSTNSMHISGDSKQSSFTATSEVPSGFTNVPVSSIENVFEDVNPIGKLQQICSKKHWNPPVYEEMGESGEIHDRKFHTACIIEEMNLNELGVGKTKKAAKKHAASKLLAKIRIDNLDKDDEVMNIQSKSLLNLSEGGFPKVSGSNELFGSDFDLLAEWKTIQKQSKPIPNWYRNREKFYQDLSNDQTKLMALKQLFHPHSLRSYMIEQMHEDNVDRNVCHLVSAIEQILNVKLNISIYGEKRDDDQLQILGEIVSNDPKYENVSILCSYGLDEDFECAKLKTKCNCVAVLLSNLI